MRNARSRLGGHSELGDAWRYQVVGKRFKI